MSPKELNAFRIDSDVMEALRRLQERDGIPALGSGRSCAPRLAGEEADQRQACTIGEPGVTSVFREVNAMNVAVYARVSTADQTCEDHSQNCPDTSTRGWTAVEYVDEGVSGAKDRRPALDQLVVDVRRHKVQAVVCWRLDRLGRNLRHLVMLLDDWNARGVAFITLGEEIDTSLGLSPSSSRRAFRSGSSQGSRGHRDTSRAPAPSSYLRELTGCTGLSHAAAARRLGVSIATVKRWHRNDGRNRPWRPFRMKCSR